MEQQKIYTRQEVFLACLLAEVKGIDCGSFGKACDRSNSGKGEYKSIFYQMVTKYHLAEAQTYDKEKLWELYLEAQKTKKKRSAETWN